MAASREYLAFISEQLSGLDGVTHLNKNFFKKFPKKFKKMLAIIKYLCYNM